MEIGAARGASRALILPLLLLGVLLSARCLAPREDRDAGAAARPASPPFREVASAAGIDFVHDNGATGQFFYPEVVQGGGGFLDYDGDGWLDVYLVQSGPLPPDPGNPRHTNRLYRNRGDGTFEDTTERAGVGDRGYGSGVAVADFDRDGAVDLYVTNLGPNRLYRNNGDGTFSDWTQTAGVGDPGYSTSAAFADLDGDSDLDLYVCNYVHWSPRLEKQCLGRSGLRSYCRPSEYQPQHDTFYRNDGDGTFTDATAAAGIHRALGPGLGVVVADLDGDSRPDIYVANDQMPNLLWRNQGDGTFSEEAMLRGAALSELGRAQAGMGVASEDWDEDGDWDLFVVNLSGEKNSFFRNHQGSFRDTTDALGLGSVSLPYTGFGTGFLDFDNDTRLDLFIANGKVSPGEEMTDDFREPNQLLRGRADGGFSLVAPAPGEALAEREVSRAAVFGDLENDGGVDVLVVNNGGPVRLLHNTAAAAAHRLIVDLDGRPAFDRNAIGASVTVFSDGRTRRRQVQPGYSYCASNDVRLHFGLADTTIVARLEVRWPDGLTQTFTDVAADQVLRVTARGAGDGRK